MRELIGQFRESDREPFPFWGMAKKIVVPRGFEMTANLGKVCDVESGSNGLRDVEGRLRERLQCEFSLIRYVPDVVKGEFANIGVVLREAGRERRRRCGLRATGAGCAAWIRTPIWSCWSRWRQRSRSGCSGRGAEGEREADAGDAGGFAFEQRADDGDAGNAGGEPAGGDGAVAADVCGAAEGAVDAQEDERAGSDRAAMRDEFERAGVWRLMRKRIAAAQYTQAGDPLKIDCGYRNGKVRMFQAVSLENDVEAAKGLAYSAAALRAGVLRSGRRRSWS